mmetsp:Transcript_24600/g.71137  ORF Transcript_24600/g.71137 Transcript_24600/m.71137 type:complete len:239 (-) Transcript_24600:244-960(-)
MGDLCVRVALQLDHFPCGEVLRFGRVVEDVLLVLGEVVEQRATVPRAQDLFQRDDHLLVAILVLLLEDHPRPPTRHGVDPGHTFRAHGGVLRPGEEDDALAQQPPAGDLRHALAVAGHLEVPVLDDEKVGAPGAALLRDHRPARQLEDIHLLRQPRASLVAEVVEEVQRPQGQRDERRVLGLARHPVQLRLKLRAVAVDVRAPISLALRPRHAKLAELLARAPAQRRRQALAALAAAR